MIETFDLPRKILAEVIADREEDLSALSTRTCGKNASYLWQYFTRHKPRALPEDVRRALADHFGLDENQLRPPGRVVSLTNHGQNVNRPVISQAVTRPVVNNKLPVLGRAIAGSAKILWDQGRPQEWVDRPSYLTHPHAFAIYVNGESMQPRYYPGERVYVDPSKPLSRDCFVVIECHDDTAMIKQYVRHTDSEVELRQLNPPQEITIKTADVRALLRIVGASER
jgi:phage repressor protein C with HTH and peptisase S24 domain